MEILEKNKNWARARIRPWWQDYEKLNYRNEPFNDASSVEKWRQLGYTQTKFTGDMYDMRNPEPTWINPFRTHLPWRHFSWSVYCMHPGCVLPNHRDTYAKFKDLHGISSVDKIWRAVVFLETWKSGHYFEIQSVPFVLWQAGDIVMWKGDTEHLAANMGESMRYTLQITGVPDENSFVQ